MSKAEFKIEIGENIKKKIKKLERKKGRIITLQEIANEIGVTADYIRKIINNKRIGSHRVILALAMYLDCSVEGLISPKNKTMSKTG